VTTLVSVLLVTFNSAAYLSRCLTHLSQQTFRDFELIIVDNGSTDKSLETLNTLDTARAFPALRLIRLDHNAGFAVANNVAARLAHSPWLALLNPDAFPAPTWLEHLVEAAKQHPEYHFFASRLIQAQQPNLLDGAGDVYHVSGLAWRRFHNMPADQFGLEKEEVFGPCGAAAMYSRQAFLEAGAFDEDFFSYHEDVDLAFRLRLRGHRCLYVPAAVVHHIGSASTGVKSNFAVYHGHRNLVWTFIKNMPAPLLIKYWPLHLLFTVIQWGYYIGRGQGRAFARAKKDAFRRLPLMWQKRKDIQTESRVTAQEITQHLSRNLLAPLKSRKV